MTEIDWAMEHRGARERVCELVGGLDDAALATTVPACPAWTVHNTMAHVAGDATEAFIGNLGDGGGQMVYDVVAHEHDIRRALGRPFLVADIVE